MPKFLSRAVETHFPRKYGAGDITYDGRCKTKNERREREVELKIYGTFRSHFAVSVALRIYITIICVFLNTSTFAYNNETIASRHLRNEMKRSRRLRARISREIE